MVYRTGLIGWPLGHSVSPAMHNAAFQALGLDGRFDALSTPPERLAETVGGLAAAGYCGVNVTIPHKETVMPLLDELSDATRRIGAVNTIVVQRFSKSSTAPGQQNDLASHGTTLRGDNTDWRGFLHPLDARGVDLAGASALLLGAGGAARAVAYALAQRGVARIAICNRHFARAEELIVHLRASFPQVETSAASDLTQVTRRSGVPAAAAHQPFHLIVNTTPIGMWPQVDESPWPAGLPMPAGALVYDLVYRPERTLLLRQAEAAGNPTQGGLEMLAAQGAAAFELWTGCKPPLDVMMAAARDSISRP